MALLDTMPGTAELSVQVKQDIVNLEMELQSCLPRPYKRPREETCGEYAEDGYDKNSVEGVSAGGIVAE